MAPWWKKEEPAPGRGQEGREPTSGGAGHGSPRLPRDKDPGKNWRSRPPRDWTKRDLPPNDDVPDHEDDPIWDL